MASVYNYGFNISRFRIGSTLIIKFFTFGYYAFNSNRILLLESGNIETNPGPKMSLFINFLNWNLNGIAIHDFVKIFLIEAFITAQNFDIVCLSVTFSDSTIDIIDTRINLNVYSLLQADQPSKTKHGVISMYFKGAGKTCVKIVTEMRLKNALDGKTCLILMLSEIFSPYTHVLATLFRK